MAALDVQLGEKLSRVLSREVDSSAFVRYIPSTGLRSQVIVYKGVTRA
jgi:hypothetical protein